MQPQDSGISPARRCPRSSIKVTCDENNMNSSHFLLFESHELRWTLTCNVTSLSSMRTSFVTKSAPIVALYCWLNFLWTYLAKSQEYQSTQSTKSRPTFQIHYIFQDTWFFLHLRHLNFNPHTAISTMLECTTAFRTRFTKSWVPLTHSTRNENAGKQLLTATLSVDLTKTQNFHTPKPKRRVLAAQWIKPTCQKWHRFSPRAEIYRLRNTMA